MKNMKALKYILSIVLLFTAVWSCDDDEFGNTDFLSSAVAPTEVSAQFSVAQDNTGNVTITPNSTGGITYEIHFGDSTPEPVKIAAGESVSHTYAESTYSVKIVANGITGLKTEVTQPLVVSFKAPEILDIEVKNDEAISYKVNVTVTADYAVSYDVNFGEPGNDSFLTANIGETISYTYAEAGTYSVNIVVKGAAIETTEETIEVEAKKITQPIEKAPKPSSRMTDDVISIFSNEYTNVEGTNFNPGWGQSTVYNEFDLNGDDMLQYSNLNYQGIEFGSDVDASSMEYLHIDVWTADLATLEISAISKTTGEKFVVKDLVPEEWNSFDIPLSEFTDQGVSMADLFQFKFVGLPWAGDGFGTIFVDNLYLWKFPSAPSPLVGTWMIAPETGAIAVGPSPDDLSWWFLNQWGDDVTIRACWMDDEYVFNEDGTFENILGTETWLENWQGDGSQHEVCGTPIAPHDGSNPATWSSSDTSITISGLGAYLGLSKVHNNGEDGAPVNNTITYDYVLSEDGNSMELKIVGYGGSGGSETWYFKLVKQ